MDLKSILAIISGGGDDAQVLASAARLATRFAAAVTVIPAFSSPASDLVRFGAATRDLPDELLRQLAAGQREEHERAVELVESIAAREGVGAGGAGMSVKPRAVALADEVAREAVLSDLVVMSARAARGALNNLFAETLLAVRAPTLLVKGEPLEFGAAAIAWDGSPQAGRAMRAALPLLRQMKSVFVFTNVDETDKVGDETAEAARVYLERHGVANVVTRSLKGADVPRSLLDAARSQGCEILIAGGYGRPRLYELVLGGATRAFVNAEGAPDIFLSH